MYCSLLRFTVRILTCSLADSPYLPTPPLSPFNSDPSVAEGDQNDADPFNMSMGFVNKVEKAPAAVVPIVPLEPDPRPVDPQESTSLHSSIGEMVRPSQIGAGAPALGRSAGHLEEPFTRGGSLSFHRPPRRYTLDQKKDFSKPKGGAPNVAFVLRSCPQIIEADSSDDESEPEDLGDDKTVYSFPCDDSKLNELVSMMASLSLGTALTVARPAITPTRVRSRLPPFVPARTPASSPVAVFHPVVDQPWKIRRETIMEVDKVVLCRNLASTGAPQPQGTSEAVLMDGVVFHPEVKDMEMMDNFATNRKPLQVVLIYLVR